MKIKMMLLLLVLLVMTSALGVTYAKHQSRKFFVQLNTLQKERDIMNVEWGRLQLELSTWATQGRIEEVARKKLFMVNPEHKKIIIVKP